MVMRRDEHKHTFLHELPGERNELDLFRIPLHKTHELV